MMAICNKNSSCPRFLFFAVSFCLVLSSCGGPDKKSDSGALTATGDSKDAPKWLNDVLKVGPEKVVAVGQKTNAASIEEGLEASRLHAAKQISQSIISDIASTFIDKIQAVVKDQSYSEDQFVQSVVEENSKAYLIGMQVEDKYSVSKSLNGRTVFDVYTRCSVPRGIFDEQKKTAHTEIRRKWYNDPQRAIETARYYLKSGLYEDMITDVEPLISQLPVEAYLLMGQAYEKQGKIDKARSLYESVIEYHSGKKEAQDARIRLKMILESEAKEGLLSAQKAFSEGDYQKAMDCISHCISNLSNASEVNDAVKLFYESAAKETVKKLAQPIKSFPKKCIAILSFTTSEGIRTKGTELLKQGILGELANLQGVRVFTPDVTGALVTKIYQRDRATLQKIATEIGCDGFVYAVAGQMTSVYIIDTEGGILGSSNLTSIAYEPLMEAAAGHGELVLKNAFISKTGGRWNKISEGEVLKSGDEFRIVFKSSRDAYVYLFLIDSLGNVNVLLPGDNLDVPAKVSANVMYAVPPVEQVFFLDENTGMEQFVLVASVEELPQLVDRMKAAAVVQNPIARSDSVKKALEELIPDTRGIGVRSSREMFDVSLPQGAKFSVQLDEAKGINRAARYFTIIHK